MSEECGQQSFGLAVGWTFQLFIVWSCAQKYVLCVKRLLRVYYYRDAERGQGTYIVEDAFFSRHRELSPPLTTRVEMLWIVSSCFSILQIGVNVDKGKHYLMCPVSSLVPLDFEIEIELAYALHLLACTRTSFAGQMA